MVRPGQRGLLDGQDLPDLLVTRALLALPVQLVTRDLPVPRGRLVILALAVLLVRPV